MALGVLYRRTFLSVPTALSLASCLASTVLAKNTYGNFTYPLDNQLSINIGDTIVFQWQSDIARPSILVWGPTLDSPDYLVAWGMAQAGSSNDSIAWYADPAYAGAGRTQWGFQAHVELVISVSPNITGFNGPNFLIGSSTGSPRTWALSATNTPVPATTTTTSSSSAQSSTTSSTPSPSSASDASGGGISGGAVAGIVIAAIAILAAIVGLVTYLLIRRRRQLWRIAASDGGLGHADETQVASEKSEISNVTAAELYANQPVEMPVSQGAAELDASETTRFQGT